MKKATKIIVILACVMMLITAFAISTVAATPSTNAGVSVPGINSPSKTLEELNLDMDGINAKFPAKMNMKYEGGKMLIPDIGADSATLYGNNAVNYELELIDGYWTAETPEDISLKSNLVINFDHRSKFLKLLCHSSSSVALLDF